MADQRDWDPEIDGLAEREAKAMRGSFHAKQIGHQPRGVSMKEIKSDKSYREFHDVLTELNVIDGKVVG
jgi:hypothetical protein